MSLYFTFSCSAATCFFASFSAFLARPVSFFEFPPFGAIAVQIERKGRLWGGGEADSVNRLVDSWTTAEPRNQGIR